MGTTNDSTTKPLPPGSGGLPLIGETLAFLKDQFHFIDERRAKHGRVFRSKVLFRDTAFLVGPEGARVFNDETKVERSGSMPSHIAEFFGGTSLPLLDGAPHRARKHQVMGAFSREALTTYIPVMESVVSAGLARWKALGEATLTDDLKRLALEVLARTMVGSDAGAEFDATVSDFKTLTAGFTAVPIPLPGTTFSRATAAQSRLFARYRGMLAAHKTAPKDDGLSRLLAAKAPDGSSITDDDAVKELHHFNLAGYIVFAHLAQAVVELAKNTALRDALRAEIAEHVGKGAITVEALHRMDLLEGVAKELKRHAPFVAVSFGRAKASFEFEGFTVPAGWLVYLCNFANGHEGDIFEDPERFDPGRYAPGRAEDQKHPLAYTTQGVGEPTEGHKCAGADFSTVLMKVFVAIMVRDYDVTLPQQDLAYRWNLVPPEYASGLRARFAKRG